MHINGDNVLSQEIVCYFAWKSWTNSRKSKMIYQQINTLMEHCKWGEKKLHSKINIRIDLMLNWEKSPFFSVRKNECVRSTLDKKSKGRGPLVSYIYENSLYYLNPFYAFYIIRMCTLLFLVSKPGIYI